MADRFQGKEVGVVVERERETAVFPVLPLDGRASLPRQQESILNAITLFFSPGRRQLLRSIQFSLRTSYAFQPDQSKPLSCTKPPVDIIIVLDALRFDYVYRDKTTNGHLF